jgi:hypothetical protein
VGIPINIIDLVFEYYICYYMIWRANYMEMVMENDDFLGNYLGLLNGLSRESKIKLVENLNFDINNNIVSETDWIDKLYGSFISDKSAETIISELRSDRRFNRKVIGF